MSSSARAAAEVVRKGTSLLRWRRLIAGLYLAVTAKMRLHAPPSLSTVTHGLFTVLLITNGTFLALVERKREHRRVQQHRRVLVLMILIRPALGAMKLWSLY